MSVWGNDVEVLAADQAEPWISLSRHPNVRSCYYLADGSIFVEPVTGGQVESALPRERLLDIAIQSARGLGHAHRHGAAHRNVGADTVLVTEDGTVKVTGLLGEGGTIAPTW